MQHEMMFANFTLLKVTFSLNNDFKEGADEVTINPDFLVTHEFRDNEKELVVIIGVRLDKGNIPYCFELQGGGLFRFAETPDEKILKQLATINCPAILFPYIRETIADLTRRAGFPPLHLVPVNFIELAKNMSDQKAPSKAQAVKE